MSIRELLQVKKDAEVALAGYTGSILKGTGGAEAIMRIAELSEALALIERDIADMTEADKAILN